MAAQHPASTKVEVKCHGREGKQGFCRGSERRRGGAPQRPCRFGPAFLLGGSTANAAQGLYNQLGQFLAAGRSAFSTGSRTPSHTQQKRAETLDRAAAKIDFGDTAGGRADALELIEQNGRDITAIRLVAHSYLAEQNYKQAERYYGRALALAPNSNLLKGELANARDLQKDDDQVLATARRQLKNNATRTQGLRLLLHTPHEPEYTRRLERALAAWFDPGDEPRGPEPAQEPCEGRDR